ncbi:MAG: hypothetical protein HC906_00385 [Bacteroidales bacterium]|nr:hypothetical protein [Bacteroidales bacterium]
MFLFTYQASAGFFPLQDGKWRIDGIFSNHSQCIDFKIINQYISKQLNVDIQLWDADWFSVFRSQKKIAGMFSKGRVFLIGDAAHAYSPVGGQGMNHGFYDAFNLAWKMVYVLKNNSVENILNTYTEERKPVSVNTAAFTDLLFNFFSGQKKSHGFCLFLSFKVFYVYLFRS